MRALQIAVLIGWALCMLSTSARAEAPLVAVFNLENKQSPLKPAELRRLTDHLRTRLGVGNRFRVVPVDELQTKLREKKKESYNACYAEACQIEIGKELAAQKVLSSRVQRFGSKCTVDLTLYDLKTGASDDSSTAEGSCTLEQVFQMVKAAAESLGAESAEERPAIPKVTKNGPEIRSSPVTSGGRGPQVKANAVAQVVGDLVIGTKPLEGVRLELTDPTGNKFPSASPYKNSEARPGRWKVSASAAGFEEEQREIDVPADALTALTIELKRLGGLSIAGLPLGASVVVVGPGGFRNEGGLPWSAEGLMHGTYRIEVTHSAHEQFRKDVEVSAGRTTEVVARLGRLGSLIVSGEPLGAALKIEGPGGFRQEGGLPWEGTDLPTGAYRVSVSREGYYTFEEEARVSPNQITKIAVRLVRTSPAHSVDTAAFPADSYPAGLLFDGTSIWMVNDIRSIKNGYVYKVSPRNGAIEGRFKVGNRPSGIAFDGSNVWVVNGGLSESVTKIDARTGLTQKTYPLPTGSPSNVIFDGSNIWISHGNIRINRVTKVAPETGRIVGSYRVGDMPMGMAFDGSSLWVANSYGDSLTKLNAASGEHIGTFSAGVVPVHLVFDGSHLWVGGDRRTLTKIEVATGSIIANYEIGRYASALAFDGKHIWIGTGDKKILKLTPGTGEVIGSYDTKDVPLDIVSDGQRLWFSGFSQSKVSLSYLKIR